MLDMFAGVLDMFAGVGSLGAVGEDNPKKLRCRQLKCPAR